MFKQIISIIQNEWLREVRNRNAVSAVVMYVFVTLFIVLQSFERIDNFVVYNAMFWIILVFGALQSIGQIAANETSGQRLFLYTLAHPVAVILGKIAFNVIFTSLIGFLTFVFYLLFFGGEPLEKIHWGGYISAIVLGIIGFASIFTMVTSITSKAHQNTGLMAVLGFPLILPLVVSLINVSIASSRGGGWDVTLYPLLSILAIIVINITLSFLLFPYLWRE